MDKDLESIQEARRLLESAHQAFLQFEHFSEEQVERILLEISKTGIAHAEPLARMAHEETGYGSVEHKTMKNMFAARDVFNAMKAMKTIGIVAEYPERKVFEVASPIGVVAAIIPSAGRDIIDLWRAWQFDEAHTNTGGASPTVPRSSARGTAGPSGTS